MDRIATLFRRLDVDPRPDGELLAAFLGDRDDSAFAELVRRHGPTVWGVCHRALPDLDDAEDAFQATFLVLVQRATRLVSTPTVGPWLFEVAVRTIANARRLARFGVLPDAVADTRPAPATMSDLDTILLGLPERYRAVLLMCYLEGLRLAALPAAASPAVAELTREVLRMFWVKKATAAGFAAVMLVAVGFGVGASVRQQPQAVGQETPAMNKTEPQVGPQQPAVPYLVLSVRGLDGVRSPYTLTEFDARGKVLWSVTPGADVVDKGKPDGTLIDLKDMQTQQNVVAAVRGYLTRVKKDPNAPHDLRVVFTNDAQLGWFSTEALRCCLDAGFEKIRFTGVHPVRWVHPAPEDRAGR